MTKIELETDTGEAVIAGRVPFTVGNLPDVVTWGGRTFRMFRVSLKAVIYRETFAYALLFDVNGKALKQV